MTTDPSNHIRSRVETIAVLVRQASQVPDLPYDAASFLSSAVLQLSQLEMHLNHMRDSSEFVRRAGDRGFQPAKLPHGQTIMLGGEDDE